MEEPKRKYKAQSIRYVENAFSFIEAGDAEKAGELLWGAMAEALKAVAASEGKKIEHHWEIGNYARELTKRLGDNSIFDAYGHASYLHSGFYEAGLCMEDVYTYAMEMRETLEKLFPSYSLEEEKWIK